jgi:hypothetical protein
MVFVVPKKDGSPRFVVDYRALNEVTVKNRYPLPLSDELFDRTQGARYFSSIDLRNGFHQIAIRPEDRPKTAFRTRFGSFEYTVLPMGLCNAPGTFMQLMNQTFSDMLDKNVLCFLDDILIFSRTEEEHLRHLRIVLTRLREQQLYAKLSKCAFMQREVEFLGHRIGADGLRVAPDKVSAVQKWPRPQNVRDVRSFLGLANFYRRFVRHYSRIALPLTELTKDKTVWQWGTEQQQAFDTLKAALCSPPVLLIPDQNKPFVLNCDACAYAIGATLQQDHGNGLQPVAYFSAKMSDAERNYDVREQEFMALMRACLHWRHYLHGTKFTLLSDHDSLKYHKTMPHLTGRLARWIEKMSGFDYELKHIPGKDNIVADALSRRVDHAAIINDNSSINTVGVKQVKPTRRAKHRRTLAPGAPDVGEQCLSVVGTRQPIVRGEEFGQSRKSRRKNRNAALTASGMNLRPTASRRAAAAEAARVKETKASAPSVSAPVPLPLTVPVETVPLPPTVPVEVVDVHAAQKDQKDRMRDETVPPQQIRTVPVPASDSETLLNATRRAADADPEYDRWRRTPPTGWHINRGLLFDEQGRLRVPADVSLRTRILAELHDSTTGAHCGRDRMLAEAQRRFEWSGMATDVERYVTTCDTCQRNKYSRQLKPGLLMPLPLPEEPCMHWTTDAVTGLPRSKRGFDAIQVYVDRLTKLKRFAATRTTDGSIQLAGTTLRTIIGPHGMPKSIVSDRDPRITAKFWRELSRVLGSEVNLSTAQHPQSDGQSEREIQTLITALRSYVNTAANDWDEYLPALELSFNSKQQASTGAAPFTLVYGTEARLPIDCALDDIRPASVPAVMDRAERMRRAIDHARSHAERAQLRQKRLADRHRRLLQLKEGDQVLLSTDGLELRSGSHKLTGRYVGPFRVMGTVNDNAVTLDLPPLLGALHPTFNITRLKPYRDGNAVFPNRPQRFFQPPAVDTDTNGSGQYEVESVVAQRGKGIRRELLVRWKGYGPEHDEWIRRSQLKHTAPLVVAEYDAIQQGGSQISIVTAVTG